MGGENSMEEIRNAYENVIENHEWARPFETNSIIFNWILNTVERFRLDSSDLG
jgi:hypothetical protein